MDVKELKSLLDAAELRNPQGFSANRERYLAEISFKAGIKEVVDWLSKNTHHEIEAGINGRDLAAFVIVEWQTQLKEWGILAPHQG